MAGGYDAYFYGKGCIIQTSKFLSLEGIYYFVCGICYVEISFIVDPWFYNLLDVPMALGNKLEMDQMVHVVCNSAKLIVFFFHSEDGLLTSTETSIRTTILSLVVACHALCQQLRQMPSGMLLAFSITGIHSRPFFCLYCIFVCLLCPCHHMRLFSLAWTHMLLYVHKICEQNTTSWCHPLVAVVSMLFYLVSFFVQVQILH